MFTPSLLISPRALRALLLLSSFVALTAVSVACGPARGGGGSDACESNEDCDDDEFCRFKDPDDDEGECRSLDTDNNTPANNNPGNNNPKVTADCDAICDKYVECALFEPEARDTCITACEDEGTISSSFQDCLLTSTCEEILSCQPPANNNPVNNTNNPVNNTNNPVNNTNNPVNNTNNPVNNNTNNPQEFTVQDCEATCDRFLQCPAFNECSPAVRNEGLSQCYGLCLEQITLIEQVSQSSCSDITPLAGSFVDLSECGPQEDSCTTSCQHLLSCTEPVCPGAIIPLGQCVELCQGDEAARAELEALGAQSCTQLRQDYCPVEGDTNAGASCTSDTQCSGPNAPFCIADSQGWTDGYCTDTCRSTSECGEGNTCLTLTDGSFCFAGCFSSGECREGYACLPLDGGNTEGVCFPRCTSDEECAAGASCNLESGICEQ